MAELRGQASAQGERAQLILVTGFALAFTLVALVLLLNTTIYTENIASRGIDRSPGEAVEFRIAVEDGVRDLIRAANNDSLPVEPSEAFGDSLDNLSRMMGRSYADRGAVAIVNNSSYTITTGVILQQTNSSQALLNSSAPPNGNWTLATGVTGLRQVRFNLSTANTNLSTRGSAFALNLSDGTDYWRVHIAKEGSAVALFVKTDSTSLTQVCSIPVSTDYVQVDLSQGTVNGQACEGFEWWGGNQPDSFNIGFDNPLEAVGTFRMVVKGTEDVVRTTNFDTKPQPTYFEGIYSVTVPLEYLTSTLDYKTNVTVVPGAPDDD